MPDLWEGDDPPRVTKIGYTIPMSYDMAIEYGLMTEEEARAKGWTPFEYPPIPFWRRVRYRIRGWWDMRPRAHFGPCNHEDCL